MRGGGAAGGAVYEEGTLTQRQVADPPLSIGRAGAGPDYSAIASKTWRWCARERPDPDGGYGRIGLDRKRISLPRGFPRCLRQHPQRASRPADTRRIARESGSRALPGGASNAGGGGGGWWGWRLAPPPNTWEPLPRKRRPQGPVRKSRNNNAERAPAMPGTAAGKPSPETC